MMDKLKEWHRCKNNWYRSALDAMDKPRVKPSLWQRFKWWIRGL